MTAQRSPAAAIVSNGLQFRLLGRLEVLRDGVPLDLGTRKQRAVLALLLLNANRVVATERLIDELWGESPPHTARSALQVYIAGLRKALGSDGAMLRTSPPGYVLELERGTLDVDRFSELRAEARTSTDHEHTAILLNDALALWRDTPLAELVSEPFENAVAQLEQLRLETLEERIDAELALGRYTELVTELDGLVAEYPYRERLRAQLMLALYGSGRQAEALQAYQAARRTLNEDLGLQPGQELRELEAAILRQDQGLSAAVDGSHVTHDGAGSATPVPGDAPIPLRLPRTRRGLIALLLPIAFAAALAAAAAVLLLRGEAAPFTAPPNSVAVIDPELDEVVGATGVGPRPGPITYGAQSVWVGNVDDKTLTRVDPETSQPLRTIPLPATPTGIDFGFGAVWVAHGRSGQLSRVDPQFNRVTTVDLAGRALYFPTGSVTVGGRWVWVVFGDSTLWRVDPARMRESQSTLVGAGSSAVVTGRGSVWVSNSGDSNVQRFDPTTFEEGPLKTYTVGRTPTGMTVADGAIWVAIRNDDLVMRINPDDGSRLDISVGDGPEALAAGAGSVWVANRAAGTISRIDPATNDVVREIKVGNAPSGIATSDRSIHVAVQGP
jgi:YVTN family beta-propeller protein